MPDRSFLDWPFLDDRHRAFAGELDGWASEHVGALPEPAEEELDGACRSLVAALAAGGWLRPVVPGADGGLDVRTLCLARETLAYWNALADFSFAMQGLGSGAISLFGIRGPAGALPARRRRRRAHRRVRAVGARGRLGRRPGRHDRVARR